MGKKTIPAYKHKNLADISVGKNSDAIGVIGKTTVRDGQTGYGIFDTFENGVASAMRLYRRKYSDKSLVGMDNGMQGYYDRSEDKGLKAMRVVTITNWARTLGIDPKRILDLSDRDTMCSFTYAAIKQECGAILQWGFLYNAYKIAFG